MTDEKAGCSPEITWRSIQWPVVSVFLVIMALAVGVVFAWIGYFTRYEASHCPADTFVVGARGPGIWVLPDLIFAIGLSGTLLLALLRLMPAIPRALDRYEATSERVYYHRIQYGFAAMAIGGGVIAALGAPAQLASHFCLARSGLFDQRGAFSSVHAYPWSDVTSVSTACSAGRAGAFGVRLGLRDGATIDLTNMTTNGRWVRQYPALGLALHGHDFAFDASAVSTSCDPDQFRMLTRRP